MKTGTFIDLFPGGVFGACFALAAVCSTWSCSIQTWRLHNEQADKATIKHERDNALEANRANVAEFDVLNRQYTALVQLQRLEASEAAKAASRATDTILLVNAKLDAKKRELENIYARIPSARAWAAAPVDAAVLAQLPHGGAGADQGGRKAGAGAGQARSASDPH